MSTLHVCVMSVSERVSLTDYFGHVSTEDYASSSIRRLCFF